MSEEEFEKFDTQGLNINQELRLRFRFGAVGEDRGVYPPFIPLTFSFERPGQSFRGHLRYGRFWEKNEEPTEADKQMLMDWAKERLASDIDAELAKDNPPAFSERHFMPRDF